MAQQEQEARLITVPTPEARQESEEIHFLEPVIVLAKHLRLLVAFPLICGALAAAVSLLLPQIFTATTRMMPPVQNTSVATALLGQLGPLAGMAGKDLGLKNPSDLYVSMLRSESISDALIQHFDLLRVYRVKRNMDAALHLASASDINAGKEGIITISVSDRDPKRASDLANAYVEELENATQRLAVTEAAKRRLFFEREVQQAGDDLANAELALKKTQENTGIIQLDNQSKAMIESFADLRAQVSSKEAQVQAMRSFAAPENPDLIRAEQEAAALKSQLARVEAGQNGISVADMPMRKVPEAALEYVRRVREVKYREALLELLTKEYEVARIDEAKDASIIQVLDKAHPPEARSWPHRSVIVIVSLLCSFVIAVILAFILEASESAASDPQFAARVGMLKYYLKNAFRIRT